MHFNDHLFTNSTNSAYDMILQQPGVYRNYHKFLPWRMFFGRYMLHTMLHMLHANTWPILPPCEGAAFASHHCDNHLQQTTELHDVQLVVARDDFPASVSGTVTAALRTGRRVAVVSSSRQSYNGLGIQTSAGRCNTLAALAALAEPRRCSRTPVEQ